ncbi:MAG: UvrD-helicase domain-containing protein [bacterium]
MTPTNEQQTIIDSFQSAGDIKINALAGTGKTTTLRLFTEKYPKNKFLYLAFNKSIVEQSKALFPSNTKIVTIHSLAYRYVCRDIDLSKLVNGYKAVEIKDLLDISDYRYAGIIQKIFSVYCNFPLKEIDKETIEKIIKYDGDVRAMIFVYDKAIKLDYNDIENKLKKLWSMFENKEIKPTHDFYIKYFQINFKKYSNNIKKICDTVLLDEAQDSNPLFIDILLNLDLKKVYVGDRHQNIYGFRKTMNAMEFLQGEDFYLTQNFRSSSYILDKANNILSLLKGERKKLISYGTIIKETNDKAIITRTNAGIVQEIIENRDEFAIKTIRNPDEIFTTALSLLKKYTKTDIPVPGYSYIDKFDSFSDVEDYAEKTMDAELLTGIRIVKEYKNKVKYAYKYAHDCIDKIQADKPIIYLTSAHTSKGLEWDSVTVHDDFGTFDDMIKSIALETREIKNYNDLLFHINANPQYGILYDFIQEVNLFYVAITRAKKELVIKDKLNEKYANGQITEEIINNIILNASENNYNLAENMNQLEEMRYLS